MTANTQQAARHVWSDVLAGAAVIRIERPARRNALNLDVKQQIHAAVAAAEDDDRVGVIIITGSNEYFVSGSDVEEMRDLTPSAHGKLGTARVFEQVRACLKPTIAAVEGYALGGGCELALACDMIIAGRDARFGQPEILVGIMPGAGGTQVLLRAAGKYRAMRLLLTGESISASEAFDLGLLSQVVETGGALNATLALGATILKQPRLSVRAIKDAVRVGQDTSLSTGLAYERRLFEQLFASEDQAEGMQAFLDKRSPRYLGR